MKISVFGANGGTGRLIVEQALATGHIVTATVRAGCDHYSFLGDAG